jgi:glycosyltransferase involved in cell wall biosynthesis
VRALRRLIHAESPDLLLTYNWGAIDAVVAAHSLGFTRVVHHEDGFNADEAVGFKRRRVWARRFVLPRVRRVIVPSRRLERVALDVWGLAPRLVAWVPNGIDIPALPDASSRAAVRSELDLPPGAWVLGSVGHLRAEKNLPRLVRACAVVRQLEQLVVVVVGDGPERERIEAEVKALGLGDRFLMLGHRQDARRLYAAMDAFALSSDTEQMPISVLEAMASALPVVGTAVGDVPSMLPPEQKPYLVPLGEHAAEGLARAIESLYADRVEAARVGLANRERAASAFGFHGMVASYRRLYSEAAGLGI